MPYPGGKAGSGIFQRIINLMPPHTVYIEPFLGDAAVMRAKRPARFNFGIDRDRNAPGLAWLRDLAVPPESASAAALADFAGVSWRWRVMDGITYLESHLQATGTELVYCDPPYMLASRKGRELYGEHEMRDVDHRRLLRAIKKLPCAVMISGYASDLYKKELKHWNLIKFEAMTRGGRTATEHLWFNFQVPSALHDYRYLGSNYRERERIKRRLTRWCRRLERMPLLERQAMFAAIERTIGPVDARSHVATFGEGRRRGPE